MSDRLLALRLFARVARTGSFSRAAREFSLSQPSASRIVAALEREVGAALLARSTRGVRLTETGADYLARTEAILDALEEADQAARGSGELRGVLRVTMSTSFALHEVVPRLPAFRRRHPRLRIDLLTSDAREDLLGEGVDVAFRFGTLADSSATARRIGSMPRVVVASPSYLRRAGRPRVPADLARHDVIFGPAGHLPAALTFRKGGREEQVDVAPWLTTSVHEVAVAAAVAGLGIVSGGRWACRDEQAAGRLVAVLADWTMDPIDVHAVFPSGRSAKPAARAFANYLAEELAGASGGDPG
jgi:DNA-binding transcriptional LysR family regulator